MGCVMSKKPGAGFASDEGMSVIEVVIAAFILFFVLTAILGLVWTTTQMGVTAKQRSAISNALSSHLEWVRSLDYGQVGLAGSTPSATIPAQSTMVIDGFTVVINTSVTASPSGVKEVQVDAVATRTGYPNLTMSQHASIRDYDNTMTGITTDTGPSVRFGTLTPTQNTVVYSSYFGNNSALNIDAVAEVRSTIPGVLIAELKFTCDGQMLRDGSSSYADVAVWQPMTDSVSQHFRWNTEQVDDTGEPDAIRDGWRTVSIAAIDSEGRRTVVERRFLVDNDPPLVPEGPIAQVRGSDEVRLSWTSAHDGTDDAWEYGIRLYKVDSTGALVLQNSIDAGGAAVDFRVTPPAFIHSATNPTSAGCTAFSRYQGEVRSYSPRLLVSDYVPILPEDYVTGAPAVYVTKPLVTANSVAVYTGRMNKGTYACFTTVDGAVTPPTFGCATLRYDLYRSTSPVSRGGTLLRANTTPTFNETIYEFLGSSPTPRTYYYQYKITYRPLGSTAGSTDEVIWSNVIGPTTMGTASVPMPHVAW